MPPWDAANGGCVFGLQRWPLEEAGSNLERDKGRQTGQHEEANSLHIIIDRIN